MSFGLISFMIKQKVTIYKMREDLSFIEYDDNNISIEIEYN